MMNELRWFTKMDVVMAVIGAVALVCVGAFRLVSWLYNRGSIDED